MGACYQDEVPQTPVTPVSVEGLVSLHSLIKQDTHRLNGTSKQRLKRHIQTLANAAHESIPGKALLDDQVQMFDRNEQRSQSSPINQVNRTWEGEGDEL